jgi:tetratricopeptide (TPR) repeat protein
MPESRLGLAKIGFIAGLLTIGACTQRTAKPEPRRAVAPVETPPAQASSAGVLPSAAPPKAATPELAFIDDDVPAATARARTAQKALFVDAWAPWCHTCLSMKAYVFTDPSLRPLAERVVFAAIDTDRESNATFLARYTVNVWPTFFVIDPKNGDVVGQWTGAASARELRAFVEDSLDVFDALGRGSLPAGSALASLLEAKSAQAEGRHTDAAERYAKALERAPADWPRRSEALLGRLQSLYYGGKHEDCVRFGEKHIVDVQGAAKPTDFADYMLACAGSLKNDKLVRSAREAAARRLRAITEKPSPEMSVDDHADAFAKLADALRSLGDRAGARAADEARVSLMEKAQREAPSPQVAATHDYGLANAYVALGRPDAAVKLLTERQRQLPQSYEPPARLASVLASMGRHREALVAVNRALELSYGRRKLLYLSLKANILGALGDRAAQIAALEQEVAGYKALPAGQARPRDALEAQKRLDAAKRR